MTEYLKDQGKPGVVSGGEYRYIRLNEPVPCVFDNEMKDLLTGKLASFKNRMEHGAFITTPKADKKNRKDEEDDPCKYCKFGMVCGKKR